MQELAKMFKSTLQQASTSPVPTPYPTVCTDSCAQNRLSSAVGMQHPHISHVGCLPWSPVGLHPPHEAQLYTTELGPACLPV